MSKKILIATLYYHDAVTFATTKLGPDKLILLVDKKPNKEQSANIKKLQETFGKFIEIESKSIETYDIVSVAEKCVEIIDAQNIKDEIFVNITEGRKTKAIGLMLASYARHERIKKIAYNPEESNSVIYLPRLSFHLSNSQKLILEKIDKIKYANLTEFAEKLKISRAILYRSIDELKDLDLLEVKDGIKLTDAGKIMRL